MDLSKRDNAMACMLIGLYAAMVLAEIERKEKRQREGKDSKYVYISNYGKTFFLTKH
ncbi:hypothetical protein [Lachnospira eligens]|jgi:hypothetical protein|uniref:hypothetical protein n=1 Tax=Lachnospira eligens TaxID=39485 RepID=UPI002094F87B|nr:hypothetical protein [Lachnospira eligens]